MLSFTKSSTSTMTMANGEVVSVTGVDTMWRYELGSCNSLVSTKIDENDDEWIEVRVIQVKNLILENFRTRFLENQRTDFNSEYSFIITGSRASF